MFSFPSALQQQSPHVLWLGATSSNEATLGVAALQQQQQQQGLLSRDAGAAVDSAISSRALQQAGSTRVSLVAAMKVLTL
jgi:hypothetical protein